RVDTHAVVAGAESMMMLATSYHREDASGWKMPLHTSLNPAVASKDHPSPWLLPVRGEGDLSTGVSSVGLVARYARFGDYHQVIGERLAALSEFLNRQFNGTRSLWYVDTGPVLERDLAQRAGLGFIGKHTNLINKRLGNWIFLS